MNRNQLYQAWQQGDEEAGVTLRKELIITDLIPSARGLARAHHLKLDEPRLEEELEGAIAKRSLKTHTRWNGFLKDLQAHSEKTLFANHLYNLCFQAWREGDNEILKKYWGLAYHDVFLTSARAALFQNNPLEESEIALRVFKRLTTYRKRKTLKSHADLVSKIRYLSRLEAKRKTKTAEFQAPLETDLEEKRFPQPTPNKRKERTVLVDRKTTVFKEFRACLQGKTLPEKLVGTPWELGIWSDFLLLLEEEEEQAVDLADRMLTALLRKGNDDLWHPEVAGLLFARLESGDKALWAQYCRLLTEKNQRAGLELGARVRSQLESKLRKRRSQIEPKILEELIDFAFKTQRRLEDKASLAPERFASLLTYYEFVYGQVCFVIARDSSDLLHRALLPELEPFIHAGYGQERITTINEVLADLERHDETLFNSFLLKHFAGLTLDEMVTVQGHSKQQTRTLLQKAEEWVKKRKR